MPTVSWHAAVPASPTVPAVDPEQEARSRLTTASRDSRSISGAVLAALQRGDWHEAADLWRESAAAALGGMGEKAHELPSGSGAVRAFQPGDRPRDAGDGGPPETGPPVPSAAEKAVTSLDALSSPAAWGKPR